MKKTFILITFTLVFSNTFSQKKDNEKREEKSEAATDIKSINLYQQMLQNNMNAESMLSAVDNRYEGTIGTPMLSNDWHSSEVIFSDGKITKDVMLKYNLVTKEIMLKRKQGDSIIVYPYQLSGFILYDPKQNISYPFLKFEKLKTNAGLLQTTFLLTNFQGKVSFYKHLSKKLVKADFKGGYSVDRRYDSYEDDSEYFVIKNEGTIEKIKLRKSDILEVLSDKKTEIEEFIKKNKIAFKSEIDVSKVLAYYQSLN